MIEAGDAVILEASASQAKLQTVRKHSEGLGEELGAIIAASEAWSSLGSRSGSKALTDAELRVAFDSIDTDSSGSIDAEELAVAIRAANSTLSNTTVAEMMSYADTDGDGRCASWTHAEGRARRLGLGLPQLTLTLTLTLPLPLPLPLPLTLTLTLTLTLSLQGLLLRVLQDHATDAERTSRLPGGDAVHRGGGASGQDRGRLHGQDARLPESDQASAAHVP